MRLADSDFKGKSAFAAFDRTFTLRRHEAEEFYATVIPRDLSADAQNVVRQGFAGMLWSRASTSSLGLAQEFILAKFTSKHNRQ
jgi:hypothetical protein